MRHRSLYIALLLVVPGTLVAQRGGGGGGGASSGGDMGGSFGSLGRGNKELFNRNADPKGPSLRARDLDDIDPLKFLVDKRKDLALTDDQVARLRAASDSLTAKNKPLLATVDSVLHDLKPPANPTDADRARMSAARQGFMQAIATVRANDDAAAKDAVATLSPDQQQKANALLAKKAEDTEKMLHDRMGGGA